MMLKEGGDFLFSLRALCDSHSFVPYNFFILISETHFFDSVPFISYAAYLQPTFPGEGKRALVRAGNFESILYLLMSRYYYLIKIDSFMALRPGEGARALRFHDLSRRGSRVVGRSDAVLHRFGEAKPSRNGCIVVRPYPSRRGFCFLKRVANVNGFKIRSY